MNILAKAVSPSATNVIRMDHTHVMAVFHQYEFGSPARIKKGLADTLCVALEIHARIEEEIFYPALRAAAGDVPVLAKSVPEHDEMRRLIAQLRDMKPADRHYDQTVMELMRDVMHHVADEETVLLPAAERVLAPRLAELGAQMMQRKLQLGGPRSGEILSGHLRGMPGKSVLVAAGVALAGTWLATRGEHGANQGANHSADATAGS